MAVARNSDELLEQMLMDELGDAQKLSPREYARLRRGKWQKLSPQLVYYYIRNGKIKQENCICGRVVIDVASADEFFEGKWGGE